MMKYVEMRSAELLPSDVVEHEAARLREQASDCVRPFGEYERGKLLPTAARGNARSR